TPVVPGRGFRLRDRSAQYRGWNGRIAHRLPQPFPADPGIRRRDGRGLLWRGVLSAPEPSPGHPPLSARLPPACRRWLWSVRALQAHHMSAQMGQRLARHGVVAVSPGGHMEAAPSRTAMLAAVARGLLR